MWKSVIERLDPERPVLIAGPTASGKSDLALAIARTQGGAIVNADALQVFADWRVLTARPDAATERLVPHRLYGHVPGDRPYSVGHWLRDVVPYLEGPRPIIVGGTGLYFTALTEGLADIPPTPREVRAAADARVRTEGHDALLAELDADSAARIDPRNPVRVQRAWEVLRSTGRGIAAWQDETTPPLLPLDSAQPILLTPAKDWLNTRIRQRFDAMLAGGLMNEVEANAPDWSPEKPSSKAIGAAELMAYLAGQLSQDEVAERVFVLTRQYAKRQRTWFRARMSGWTQIDPERVGRPSG